MAIGGVTQGTNTYTANYGLTVYEKVKNSQKDVKSTETKNGTC